MGEQIKSLVYWHVGLLRGRGEFEKLSFEDAFDKCEEIYMEFMREYTWMLPDIDIYDEVGQFVRDYLWKSLYGNRDYENAEGFLYEALEDNVLHGYGIE